MEMADKKIAVYGAGAMGTVLGAFLTEGGVKTHLISRNVAHVAVLKKTGARISCVADGIEKRIPVEALLPEEMTGSYDVIFLMTKQRENRKILTFLSDYLTDEGIVCILQNGLPEAAALEVLDAERVYGGAVSFGANFLGEGRVELTSNMAAMSIEVGGYQNGNEKTPLLVEILSRACTACGNENFVKGTQNLAGARWSKLAINSAFSGLSVATGLTFGEIAKRRKTRKVALKILWECMAVAKAAGVTMAPLQGHDMEKLLGGKSAFNRLVAYMVLPFAMKKHKKLRSGMLRDVQNGRKCEIDFINGAVVKEGKRVGVKTPVCEMLVEMVHGIENGLYETDYKNVDFFFDLMREAPSISLTKK